MQFGSIRIIVANKFDSVYRRTIKNTATYTCQIKYLNKLNSNLFFSFGPNDAPHGHFLTLPFVFFSPSEEQQTNRSSFVHNCEYSGLKCDRNRVTRSVFFFVLCYSSRFNEFQFLHPSRFAHASLCFYSFFFLCVYKACVNLMGHFYLVHINEMQFKPFLFDPSQ